MSGETKILVVDDETAILDTLRGACAPGVPHPKASNRGPGAMPLARVQGRREPLPRERGA